jgi:hypothetical protein
MDRDLVYQMFVNDNQKTLMTEQQLMNSLRQKAIIYNTQSRDSKGKKGSYICLKLKESKDNDEDYIDPLDEGIVSSSNNNNTNSSSNVVASKSISNYGFGIREQQLKYEKLLNEEALEIERLKQELELFKGNVKPKKEPIKIINPIDTFEIKVKTNKSLNDKTPKLVQLDDEDKNDMELGEIMRVVNIIKDI